MTIPHQKMLNDSAAQASLRLPETYELNEYGAPLLDGTSFWDMGLYLLFIEQMGVHSDAPNLEVLLSKTRLTCKNWIKKHRNDTKAVVSWSFSAGGHYVVEDWGIYHRECFEPYIPHVRSIIDLWLEQRDEQPRTVEPSP